MPERSNEEWIEELRGDRGVNRQTLAYQELTTYLSVVAFNYLVKRRDDLMALRRFSHEELDELAQDFVQDTLEKLYRDDYALLTQFRGFGRFLSWMAQIVCRQAGQELRKSYWHTQSVRSEQEYMPSESVEETLTSSLKVSLTGVDSERATMRKRIAETLQMCIEGLTENRRWAFWECVVEEEDSRTVAYQLDTSVNAVYLLVYRAKKDLRECLRAAGIDESVFSDVFSDY